MRGKGLDVSRKDFLCPHQPVIFFVGIGFAGMPPRSHSKVSEKCFKLRQDPVILFLYNAVLLLALVAAAPLLLVRARWRDGLRERCGAGAKRVASRGRPVWVHAVSVGEVMAVSPLVEELDQRLGADAVVISTTTRTGQSLARERFGARRCFYFPLDLPWVVHGVLRVLHPRLLLLAESELWPNLLTACERADVPVMVVNARISDRSLPRYRRLRPLWRPFLRKLMLVLAQSEEDARRFVSIGAPAERVRVGGNLKYDARTFAVVAPLRQFQDQLSEGARVLVAGSTLEDEEAALLRAWPAICEQMPAVMVLAPRHPERFDRVAALVVEQGVPLVRRSTWKRDAVAAGSVFLLDSMGELAGWYWLADVAFVGGSLVAAGGHNPLEPARFGKPVVMGPHFENFRQAVRLLRDRDALLIAERDQLGAVIAELLTDTERAAAMGARGREVFAQQAGATGRAAAAVMQLLGEAEA
jgi:3-deoxy-D-manno-octulosonic-acid transferase